MLGAPLVATESSEAGGGRRQRQFRLFDWKVGLSIADLK